MEGAFCYTCGNSVCWDKSRTERRGRELVKEAAKAQTTKGDTLSDEAQEVYAFKMLKEGDDYFWYLTDGGDNVRL